MVVFLAGQTLCLPQLSAVKFRNYGLWTPDSCLKISIMPQSSGTPESFHQTLPFHSTLKISGENNVLVSLRSSLNCPDCCFDSIKESVLSSWSQRHLLLNEQTSETSPNGLIPYFSFFPRIMLFPINSIWQPFHIPSAKNDCFIS